MPARQRGAIFRNIAGSPQHAAFVELPRYVIVGAEDVEIAGLDARDHEVDGLFAVQAPGRLLGAAARGQRREDVTGIIRCALILQPGMFRSSCCSASVCAFTPAFETL